MLSPQTNKRIGQAMHDYGMLSDGDRVLVAVSGGIDSLVLLWLLKYWQRKAPVNYTLLAVHIDMEIRNGDGEEIAPLARVQEEVTRIDIPLRVEKSLPLADDERNCFSCSKLRRKQLFDLAADLQCNKLALGHHKDDLLETLLLNMCYSGNISTMVPKQELFAGKLAVIRPLAYLDKAEVEMIGETVGLKPVKNPCPLAGNTRREKVQEMLQHIYREIPGAKGSLFASLKNVREGYLL